jgi:hypothetical protein
MLTLAYGLSFADLYTVAGARALDSAFCTHLAGAAPDLAARLVEARRDPSSLSLRTESDLLIAVAPHLEDFIAALFGIEPEVRALEARHHALAPLFAV